MSARARIRCKVVERQAVVDSEALKFRQKARIWLIFKNKSTEIHKSAMPLCVVPHIFCHLAGKIAR